VPTFVPGLELSRRFYVEAVRPILDAVVPGVPHAAARVGAGSEVLGLDTARSTDHDWGPRLDLFLPPGEVPDRITAALTHRLPAEFLGYPTRFTVADDGTRGMAPDGAGDHWVEIHDVGPWFAGRLGFDPGAPIEPIDWLAAPAQRLREAVGGAVFHDDLGTLTAGREALGWYPRDVWLFVLGCQWRRIAQGEALVGRAAEAGDEAGARVVAARLVRDAMRLVLLMRRRYPPYDKWLGSDLARSGGPPELADALAAALAAPHAAAREAALTTAYSLLAREHNALGLTEPLDPACRPFHSRPYRVLGADRFTSALLGAVRDPWVAALPPVGAVDQFVDGTDVLTYTSLCRAITRAALAAGPGGASAAWAG
jgi:hypothetical protein